MSKPSKHIFTNVVQFHYFMICEPIFSQTLLDKIILTDLMDSTSIKSVKIFGSLARQMCPHKFDIH